MVTSSIYNTPKYHRLPCGTRARMYACAWVWATWSLLFIFGVTFVHANLCMHILASTRQDDGNPFPVIRLPVVNSVTDSSRHTLRLPVLHSQWSCQVYIIHRSITGFLVVQEPTCTHTHEYRLPGASCYFWCHICACKFMHAYFSFDLLRWRQSISGY